MERKSGHATGMVGEFFVMERLFRLGHEPALTLGNAKHIDILVKTRSGKVKTVSVKAVRGGGKWPVGRDDFSAKTDLIFIFLLYRRFDDVKTDPEVWVIPADHVQRQKRRWMDGYGLYYSTGGLVAPDLDSFRDAWQHVE